MVSNDRGRREVCYYVVDERGERDLAVVGSEKSVRHMTYAVPEKFFESLIRISATVSSSSVAAAADVLPSDRKLRSRRQVVDWLSLLVSDSMPYGLPPMVDRYSDDEDASTAYVPNSKFSWLGSSWDCRKRRKHYRSFYRNGITISVNDFVYVLMEDNKRLVAYIEDLYEDMMARNMVAARWFHKVDEVSIVLPPDTNDREIFFSLCLQDFSVECIDGLASVLGSEDFEKFQKESLQRHSLWEPYLCRRLIDNDNVKPFDITRLKGYWGQNLLRSMYPSYLKLRLKRTADGNQNGSVSRGNGKRKPLPSSGLLGDIGNLKFSSAGNRLERNRSVADSSTKGLVKKNTVPLQQALICPGANIELFSQDSGMRGCWFSCVVLKRCHDKIKVQYRDVQDADETGNLEEWVSTSRTAAPDKLGIRVLGRPIVRPCPSKKDASLLSHEVGEAVDAWWHDGWWEGIVISSDGEDTVRVYFPGEQQVSIFGPSDLRSSRDWVENKWNRMKKRPDIASLVLSELDGEKCSEKSSDCITFQSPSDALPEPEPIRGKENRLPRSSLAKDWRLQLTKDFHDGLRWSSTRKRTHGRQLFRKEFARSKRARFGVGHKCSGKNSGAFLMPKSLSAVDEDNCKISGEPLFSSPMSALCSNLVMTR